MALVKSILEAKLLGIFNQEQVNLENRTESLESTVVVQPEPPTPALNSSPDPDFIITVDKLPSGAVKLTKTFNFRAKERLITLSGDIIWPILSGSATEPKGQVFLFNNSFYAVPKRTKYGKNWFYRNPKYLEQREVFTVKGISFKMINTKDTKVGIDLVQALELTLAELDKKNLLSYADLDGRNGAFRDIEGKGNLSGHAFMVALDVNNSAYPQGKKYVQKYLKAIGESSTWAAPISNKDKKRAEVIKVFSEIEFNGKKIWGWGKSFNDVHHFTQKFYSF